MTKTICVFTVFLMIFSAVFTRTSAQNLNLQNTAGTKTIEIKSGKWVKVLDNNGKYHKGKLKLIQENPSHRLAIGKDTLNMSNIKSIRVYFGGTRIAGNIVGGSGALVTVYGLTAMAITGFSNNEWSDLAFVVSTMITVAGAAVTGVGVLVRSISTTYRFSEWQPVNRQNINILHTQIIDGQNAKLR